MSLLIVDSQPPQVTRCPNSFQVFLAVDQVLQTKQNAPSSSRQFIKELYQESRAVEWEEPEFTDNVGVTSVMASQLPGQRLGLGRQATLLPPPLLLFTF
jgi:hypothetical protein